MIFYMRSFITAPDPMQHNNHEYTPQLTVPVPGRTPAGSSRSRRIPPAPPLPPLAELNVSSLLPHPANIRSHPTQAAAVSLPVPPVTSLQSKPLLSAPSAFDNGNINSVVAPPRFLSDRRPLPPPPDTAYDNLLAAETDAEVAPSSTAMSDMQEQSWAGFLMTNNLNFSGKDSAERIKNLLPKHVALCSDVIRDELLETVKQRSQLSDNDVIHV